MYADPFRIGNYVQHNGVIDRITTIDVEEDGQASLSLEKAAYIRTNYQVILLTDEWLKWCGFIDGKLLYRYTEYIEIKQELSHYKVTLIHDKDLELFNYTDDPGVTNIYKLRREIYFVHHLQNLYYELSGEELKINSV